MSRARRAAALACALLVGASAGARACELLLAEHRSGRELARMPLDAAAPRLRIAFTHSVLGTPVLDSYRWQRDGAAGRWHLVEERFEGEGYGLPHNAGAGERMERDGQGWRLRLDRIVHPLVVLPLPAQRMRVLTDDGREWLLGALTAHAVEFKALDC